MSHERAQRLLAANDGASLDRNGRLSGATNRDTAVLRKLVDHLLIGMPASCSLSALHELEGRLKALFGMTSGEARVTVMLYQTPGLQIVADRLGLSRAIV